MTLDDPTTQQSAFVSLVTAMLSASFALWLGKEAKTDRIEGMIGILSSVANLATTFIDSKAKVKRLKLKQKMKIATGEISWEQAAIEPAQTAGRRGLDSLLYSYSARIIRALATTIHEARL